MQLNYSALYTQFFSFRLEWSRPAAGCHARLSFRPSWPLPGVAFTRTWLQIPKEMHEGVQTFSIGRIGTHSLYAAAERVRGKDAAKRPKPIEYRDGKSSA